MVRRIKSTISKIFYRLQRLVWPNERQRLYSKWFAVNGDQTLRVEYPLRTDSIVFDVGGYRGQWAADIRRKSDCTIFIFEPVKQYAEVIRERFRGDPRVIVYSHGLGAADEVRTIWLSDDATSLFRVGEKALDIEIKDVVAFLKIHDIREIDLMNINIEGGEYELLEAIV